VRKGVAVKILQIIYESLGSPFGFGGAGIRAYEIYKRLRERHEITLLCMKYPGARDGEIEGLKHIFAGVESKSLVRSVLSFTIKAAGFVRRHGKDFDVIVENFLPATPFFAKYLTSTPVILQIQDFWGKHTFGRYPFRVALPMFLVEKSYPRLYKQHLFVSPVTREKYNLRGDAVIIPNGIDGALLQFHEKADKENKSILFLSSIDFYKKGLDLLLDAFLQLSPRYDDLDLLIAGIGRDYDAVKHKVNDLPVTVRRHIKLLGWISGTDKTKVLSSSLFVVLPSRHESQPISVLEAAACGTPVIVSDIDELKFVEENKFGISFPSGSVKALRDAIELLIENHEMRHGMGKSGRTYAEGFLWDTVALEFEKRLRVS
jgi:glycosyltransferase involved in cell wall biosynthesis